MKRDIPALIESLRIRALALTGAEWERNATRDMMNEAAQQLEDLTAKFKPDVAYMPVPRCESCVQYIEQIPPTRSHGGGFCKMLNIGHMTKDFGCVQWKVKS